MPSKEDMVVSGNKYLAVTCQSLVYHFELPNPLQTVKH